MFVCKETWVLCVNPRRKFILMGIFCLKLMGLRESKPLITRGQDFNLLRKPTTAGDSGKSLGLPLFS
jgi:hypothetical protein